MDWIPIAVALGGSVLGGYLGVKIAVSVLQTKMETVQEEIKSLRTSRHDHAGMIQEHESRIHSLEKWRENQ